MHPTLYERILFEQGLLNPMPSDVSTCQLVELSNWPS